MKSQREYIRLWHETEPREVVAEFLVSYPKPETDEQRKARGNGPVPVVAYTVVVVR